MATFKARQLRRGMREVIDRNEPLLAAAFRESARNIVADVQMKYLVEALAAKDVERVIQVLDIEPVDFAPVRKALAVAFEEAGMLTARNMPALPRRK